MIASLRDALVLSAWFEPPYALIGWVVGISIASALAVAVGTAVGNKLSGGAT